MFLEAFDEAVWTSLAEPGVLALMCDSTNVFNTHEGRSESTLGEDIEALIASSKGMFVATTFASNVARVKQLAEATAQFAQAENYTFTSTSKTERPEGVAAGTAELVGPHADRIVAACTRLLDDPAAYEVMARAQNPYGDGDACAQIADALMDWLASR